MADPRARFLNELLGFVFVRLVLFGSVVVAMWAFLRGYTVPAIGLTVALAYFFYLLWGYAHGAGVPEP